MTTINVTFDAETIITDGLVTPLVATVDISALKDWNDYMEPTASTVKDIVDPASGRSYDFDDLQPDDIAALETALQGAIVDAFTEYELSKAEYKAESLADRIQEE